MRTTAIAVSPFLLIDRRLHRTLTLARDDGTVNR